MVWRVTVGERTRKKALILELCGGQCVPPYLTKASILMELGFYTPLETGYLVCITRYPYWGDSERFWVTCPDRAALMFWMQCSPNVEISFLAPKRFLEYFPDAVAKYGIVVRTV